MAEWCGSCGTAFRPGEERCQACGRYAASAGTSVTLGGPAQPAEYVVARWRLWLLAVVGCAAVLFIGSLVTAYAFPLPDPTHPSPFSVTPTPTEATLALPTYPAGSATPRTTPSVTSTPTRRGGPSTPTATPATSPSTTPTTIPATATPSPTFTPTPVPPTPTNTPGSGGG